MNSHWVTNAASCYILYILSILYLDMDLGYNSQPWCRFLGNLLRHFLRVDLLLVLTFWFHRYMLLSILILRAMTTKHKTLEGMYKITKIGIQIDISLTYSTTLWILSILTWTEIRWASFSFSVVSRAILASVYSWQQYIPFWRFDPCTTLYWTVRPSFEIGPHTINLR